MSNNAILNSVTILRYGEIALQPTKEIVEFVPVPEIALYYNAIFYCRFGTLAIKRWLNLPPDSLVLVQKRVDRRKLHSHNHRSCCSY